MTGALERILSTPLKVNDRDPLGIRVADDGYFVASVSARVNDAKEYAQLFAASPSLLRAVKTLLATNPVFRSKPMGGEGSAVRLQQADQIAAEDAVREIIRQIEGAA